MYIQMIDYYLESVAWLARGSCDAYITVFIDCEKQSFSKEMNNDKTVRTVIARLNCRASYATVYNRENLKYFLTGSKLYATSSEKFL